MLLLLFSPATAFHPSRSHICAASKHPGISGGGDRSGIVIVASASDDMSMRDAFSVLDDGLARGESLWRPEPYYDPCRVAWRRAYPHLYRDILRLSNAELWKLYESGHALHKWMCERVPSFEPLAKVSHLLEERAAAMSERRSCHAAEQVQLASWRVPGKKSEEVEAFAASMPKRRQPAVEWCSGKGYLSQRLVAHGVVSSSVCLEVDPALCDAGRQIARSAKLPIRFEEADVLEPHLLPSNIHSLQPPVTHVALHACGGLHREMLRCVVRKLKAADVAIAPCCYHRYSNGESLKPLSKVASRSHLRLANTDLKLATSGTCAVRKRKGRIFQKERIWRKAFAAWYCRAMRRQAMRGNLGTVRSVMSSCMDGKRIDLTRASRLPSAPKKLLSPSSASHASLAGFEAFCRWGATVFGDTEQLRKLLLPALDEWNEREASLCLQIGEKQVEQVTRLDLVRYAYRRPLEQWLVLDLCLFLEEHGYDVDMVQLCEQSISPRNLLVLGHRQ